MKKEKAFRTAIIMASCTAVLIAGGAFFLNTAIGYVQHGEAAAKASPGSEENETVLQLNASADPDTERSSDASETGKGSDAGLPASDSKQKTSGAQEDAGTAGERAGYFCRPVGTFADSSKQGVYLETKIPSDHLFYMDLASGQVTWLCSREGCQHYGAENCDAYFQEGIKSDTVQIVGDQVYVFENGGEAKYYLYRMNLDGSSREKMVRLLPYGILESARIIDDNVYAQMMCPGTKPDEARDGIYQQSIYHMQTVERIFPSDEEKWYSRKIHGLHAVGKKLYFQESRQKKKDGEFLDAVWEYDTVSGQLQEILLLKNEKQQLYDYVIAEDWIYYSEYEQEEGAEAAIYKPVMRKNLTSGKTEQTDLPAGSVSSYDGRYIYIERYDGKDGLLKSIDAYTLDGKLVQSIPSPVTTHGPFHELNKDLIYVGATYDTLILHDCPANQEGFYHDETIYVYDKAQIDSKSGSWKQFSMHISFQDQDGDGKVSMKEYLEVQTD